MPISKLESCVCATRQSRRALSRGPAGEVADADLYRVLGVPRDASAEAIKVSYRALAKRYHPDLNPGDASAEASFKVVSEAYSVLADAAERRAYDARHHWAGLAAGRGGGGGGGSGSGGWSEAAAAARAREAARGGFAAPGFARTRRSDARSALEDDPFDFDEWERMQFGPTAAQRDAQTAQRVREARAGGFAAANDARAGRGENWERRRTMRQRAEAWESEAAAAEAAPLHGRATAGESETAHYRRFAAAFRERRAASDRAWPLRLVIWGAAVALLWAGSREVLKPR